MSAVNASPRNNVAILNISKRMVDARWTYLPYAIIFSALAGFAWSVYA